MSIERYCVVATADKHASLERNLADAPVEYYLRDSERATDVRGYIEVAQSIEALCFKMPAPNWAIAHFGINGGAMLVTAEVENEPVAAQYVAADCWEGKMGLRFWTTVVHPELRRMKVGSILTAVSTQATASWAEFGGTICDTDSSLMGRNIRLDPMVVTANMHHTPGRRKVQLEWRTPDDPFTKLLTPSESPIEMGGLPVLESLAEYDVGELPAIFNTSADSMVWEDIALCPEKYRRFLKLVGYDYENKHTALSPLI